MNFFERIGLARAGKLSLTNVLVVAVTAHAAFVPTLGWPDIIALVIAILNYIHRRTTDAKTGITLARQMKLDSRLRGLESWLADAFTQVRSGQQTLVENTANGVHVALTTLTERVEGLARTPVVDNGSAETLRLTKEMHDQITALALAMGIRK